MSDMIERVAQAILAKEREGLINEFHARVFARAAIAAMRDIKLPDDVRFKGYPSGRAMYEAVIDAALEER